MKIYNNEELIGLKLMINMLYLRILEFNMSLWKEETNLARESLFGMSSGVRQSPKEQVCLSFPQTHAGYFCFQTVGY